MKELRPGSDWRRWRESDHLERAVQTAGGEEPFEEEIRRSRAEGVADRRGDVSTREVLDRYVAALGGTLKLIADLGDEQLKVS
ncbi:hypothetical protein ACFQ0B_33480 [Nonomuraea thailandensis]